MNADEVVRALRYVQEKHRNDRLLTLQTDVSAMARDAADMIESLQAQLADYHHMSKLVDGKMAENQRLRRINENLQAQLSASQRREKAAVESWRGFCSKCDWRGHMWLSDGQLDGRCKTCRDNSKCNWQWRGPLDAGEEGAEK